MTTSKTGVNLIKKYEGCKLVAYKPVQAEKYWTIGWGHYGADVVQNMIITQGEADDMLVRDLVKYEADVERICGYLKLNQNQFDALVSFTYNCGEGNLLKLTKSQTRTAKEISEHIEAYNKEANGQVLPGLVKRRAEEKELFLTPVKEDKPMEELTIQQKCEKIKEYYGFDDNTCMYFQFYRYNVALIDKLYHRAVNSDK